MSARAFAAALIAISCGALAQEAEVYLPPAPRLDPRFAPPAQAPSMFPKAVVPTPAIDTSSRAAVKAAYNTYYNIAMPAVSFTGNVSSPACVPGTISLAFQEWTISRINFLRAMAGVPGNTALDSTQNARLQAAALIMAANGLLDHDPLNTLLCWTQLGHDAAGQSNLSQGATDSIPVYMSEPGAGNYLAGHRRWVLHSRKGVFGLGQAGSGGNEMSALYAFDASGGSPSTPNGIPWPPRGYVPLTLFPTNFTGLQRWSFGYAGDVFTVSFAAANVTMTLNGSPVAINVVSRTDIFYGDNTIVWELPVNHVVTKGSVYDITISGVAGTPFSSYNYQVRPFDVLDPIVPVATDLNGDTRSDLLYRNTSTGQVYRLFANGLALSGGSMIYNEPNTAWKIVADADFNGDGVTDLLYRNDSTGQVFMLLFSSSGVPSSGGIVYTEPNPNWKIVHTPDIDGDGKADILWWNSATGQVYAMIMNGLSIAAANFVYTEPNLAWKIAAVGDFAGSGKRNQLLYRNSTTGQVYLMTVGYSAGSFTQSGVQIYQEPNTAWKIVAAADFSGDGRSDILWRNDATGQVFLMLMNGAAISNAALIYQEVNLAWKIVAVGDYGGDGKADLLWRNDATGQVYMMLMNGFSITSAALVYTEPSSAWKILGPAEYGQATGVLQ